MKAFVFFLSALATFIAFALIGTIMGAVPQGKPLTLFLVLVGLLTFGTKFVVADLLSSDGFQLNKASTDICLTALSAICSLAIVQSLGPSAVFNGPAFLLFGETAGVTPSAVQTIVAAWILTGIALFLFATCLSSARWGRAIKPYSRMAKGKRLMSEVYCVLAGSVSFSSYLVTIFFKA